MSDSAVIVRDLTKIYEPTRPWMRVFVRSPIRVAIKALDGVSLRVDSGRLCAVIGANGAGKSTLFRILTGLTTPTRGQATLVGLDAVIDANRIRRQVGFMPADDRTLFLRHTCRENLRFHGRLQGMEDTKLRPRIDEVLKMVGLSDSRDRTGFALSSGMRARLMFARAILHEPRVLILDEPTGSIDLIGARHFLNLIVRTTVEQGTATLISSHRLEEIDALRDNVLLLDSGRVVFSGNLDHVSAVAENMRYEVTCVDLPAAQRVGRLLQAKLGPAVVVETAGSNVLFPSSEGSHDYIAALAELGSEVVSVVLRKLSMSETISALLGENPG